MTILFQFDFFEQVFFKTFSICDFNKKENNMLVIFSDNRLNFCSMQRNTELMGPITH